MDLFQYQTNATAKLRTTTVMRGQPDAVKTNIVDGIKEVTVVGLCGQMVCKTNFDIASGIMTSVENYSNYDAYNRPRKITYLDGTFNWIEHGCCGNASFQTNREGTTITNFQDALKRSTATLKNGITVTNALDAAGRVIKTTRIGTNGNQIVQTRNTYDNTGELVNTTNALGHGTTFSETVTDNQLSRTTTYPDGNTRIEQYFRDKRLAKVSGTAVHPVRYTYGSIQDGGTWRSFTAEIKLDANGSDTPEVVTNLFDMVGRPFKTIYADQSFRRCFYNVKGQRTNEVDPDGVSRIFIYNARGEPEYTVLDMDRNGAADFAGIDLIQRTASIVTNNGISNVRQVRTYAWNTLGSDTSLLTSLSEITSDGLRSWNSSFGVTSQMRTRSTWATVFATKPILLPTVLKQSPTTFMGNCKVLPA